MRIIIYLIILFNYSLCKSRNSTNQFEECICDDDFCYVNHNNTCSTLCDCYHFWQTIINSTKLDTLKFIKIITNHYIGDYQRLENNFYLVTNKLNQSNVINTNITASINIINNYIDQINDEFNNIKNTILEIEQLNKMKFDGNNRQFLKLIRRLYKRIKDMSNKLQGVDDVNFKRWESYDILEQIQEFLKNYNEAVPTINNLDFLKNFDNKLNFLETVLMKYTNNTDKIPNIEDNQKLMAIIENDVQQIKILIIDIINHQLRIFEYVDDVKKLLEKAINIQRFAKKFKQQFEEIMRNETRFLQVVKLLEKERDYWRKIGKLQINLRRIENSTQNLNRKITNFRNTLNEINDELNINKTIIGNKLQKYINKQQQIDNKINKFQLNEEDLNELLLNILITKEKIQQFDRMESINDLDNDIKQLNRQLENYIEEILKYCRVQNRRL